MEMFMANYGLNQQHFVPYLDELSYVLYRIP